MFDAVPLDNASGNRSASLFARLDSQTPPRAKPASVSTEEAAVNDVVRVATDAPIRENLVQRIRERIAAGTYLTDEKFDLAVDRLHATLRGCN